MWVSYIERTNIPHINKELGSRKRMINKNLVGVYDAWVASGSQQQEGFNWISTRNKWLTLFAEDSEFIKSVPQSLDRIYLREICADRELCIRNRFLAVMIWGYGDRAYGPFRVSQMFTQSNVAYLLNQTFDLAASGCPIQAYSFLSKNRIHYLGPSYTSKFVSFCTPREISAPIFDSFIATWLAEHATKDFEGFSLNSQTWNIQTYSRYITWIQEHADYLNAFPDDLELVIFRDAEEKYSKTSRWVDK